MTGNNPHFRPDPNPELDTGLLIRLGSRGSGAVRPNAEPHVRDGIGLT
jgi:hypothetical protein